MGKEKTSARLDEAEIRRRFSKICPKYKKLAQNLKEAMESFLTEEEIEFHAIKYRIKNLDSFIDKINRKDYSDPFEQTDDLCGLRIICYFRTDQKRIREVVEREFDVITSEHKEDQLSPETFGYRSDHFVVKIKKDWLQAPNYRGLDELKAEIQVRTILSHAWAEIQHKLQYKKKYQVADMFKRKFSRIAAQLEEADERFEELRDEAAAYRKDLTDKAKQKNEFDPTLELNLDNLQAFLDFFFPELDSGSTSLVLLLDELREFKFTMKDLVTAVTTFKEIQDVIFVELAWDIDTWGSIGLTRFSLILYSEDYYRRWQYSPSESAQLIISNWRENLKSK